MSKRITKTAPAGTDSFTTRVLMGMRDDIENLLETAGHLCIQYNALAKEHGIAGRIEIANGSGMNADINATLANLRREYGLEITR